MLNLLLRLRLELLKLPFELFVLRGQGRPLGLDGVPGRSEAGVLLRELLVLEIGPADGSLEFSASQ